MPAIRAILFDKDGTLVDFDRTWRDVAGMLALEAADGDEARAGELLAMAGFDPATRRFRPDSAIAAGTSADIVALWYPALDEEGRRAAVARFDAVSAERAATGAVPVGGAVEAVAALHGAGLRIGMATNDSTRGGELTVRAFGIAQMFSAVYGYDAVARPKPAPDAVEAFADLIGMPARRIAVVGDNRHDLDMARSAGAGRAIAVLSGNGTAETLARHADAVLDSVADLPAYLGVEG